MWWQVRLTATSTGAATIVPLTSTMRWGAVKPSRVFDVDDVRGGCDDDVTLNNRLMPSSAAPTSDALPRHGGLMSAGRYSIMMPCIPARNVN